LRDRKARCRATTALAQLKAKHSINAPYQIAAVHATRGVVDAALTWLERAIAEKDAGAAQMRVEPVFRGLHGDPRWSALMKKLGFDA